MMLSIIIPVYNVEKYLNDCLNSILTQSFADYEILLIDDGSTDGSPALCDEYAKNESRIHVIHSQNKGVSNARNIGIEAANGEYFLFVDADDVLAGKDAIRDIMQFTKDPDVDMVAARSEEFYDGKPMEKLSEGNSDSRYYVADSGELRRFISKTYMMSNLYSRRALGDIRFDTRVKLGEDLLFLVKIISNVQKPIIYDRVFYYRRLRLESASHTGFKQGMIEENEYVMKRFYEELHGKPGGDELFEKYYADQTGMINRLTPEYKKHRNEVQIVQGRIRKCFPHFLRNRLIKPQTKVFLTLYLVSPALFYALFKHYKTIKYCLVKRSQCK